MKKESYRRQKKQKTETAASEQKKGVKNINESKGETKLKQTTTNKQKNNCSL